MSYVEENTCSITEKRLESPPPITEEEIQTAVLEAQRKFAYTIYPEGVYLSDDEVERITAISAGIESVRHVCGD
jgi:hypothetical protein